MFGVILFSAAAALATLSQRRGEDAATPPPAPMPVSVFKPYSSAGYDVTRWYVGRVEAARESRLGFELAGALATVVVEEGQRVQAGEHLAQLDRRRLQAQRAELEAAVAEAEARRRLAASTLGRLQGVLAAGGVSRQQLEEAREGLEVAQATLNLARSRVDTILVELEKTTLRAPFGGILVRRLVDEGRVLAAGEPVLEILESGPAVVRIGVASEAAEALRVESVHPVKVRNSEYAARVIAVLPALDPSTRTVDVLLAPEGEAIEQLRHGELASLALRERQSIRGFWLPLDALTEGLRGTWNVYRLEAAVGTQEFGAVRAQPVSVEQVEGERVYVTGDFPPSTQLVAKGLHRLVPGQQVRARSDFALAPREVRHGKQ
jgi:RND family efflux transporter MFP subunit